MGTANPSTVADAPQRNNRWTSGPAIVAYLAAFSVLLHIYADKNYGYFVDELYYLACSQHLSWGYVDQPPLIAVITRFERVLLGDELHAIRFFPALASAALILLTGALARQLGARRFGQALAALCVLVAGIYLLGHHLLTMNAFEPLFWMGCAWLVIRIITTGNEKLWLWFGVLAGLGLLNKYSMLIFGFGVVVGLLLTPQRKSLRQPWIWIGGLIAFAIFLPNLIWNIHHHFPFLELQANIRRSGRNVPMPPWDFMFQQVLMLMPLTLPAWAAGLWHYFTRAGRPFRVLGWTYLVVVVVVMVFDPRVYYAGPVYPMLFAAGGVVFESWLAKPRLQWIKSAYAAALVIVGAMFAPFAIPVLPVEMYLRYTRALHLEQPRIETHRLGPLPQIYADMFGWEEMTKVVARAYNALPPDVRTRTAIFAQNYGQAGAIDLFGKKYGLPKAVSGHQSYWLWGPRDYTGDSMIVMDDDRETLERLFTHVERVGAVHHPYSMPYEHFDVWYCRGLKMPLKDLWPQVKNWG